MPDDKRIKHLTELFKETGQAHDRAFIENDGDNPDWPIWYATYLRERLKPLLGAPITRSRLVFCLVATDDEYRATDPDAPWPEYYSARVLECLGPAADPKTDHLALYHFEGCPFCMRVRREIDALDLDVELRDIYGNRQHFDELREARGRTTVPVLRITDADGEGRWMPESADIVRYLQSSYGRAAA